MQVLDSTYKGGEKFWWISIVLRERLSYRAQSKIIICFQVCKSKEGFWSSWLKSAENTISLDYWYSNFSYNKPQTLLFHNGGEPVNPVSHILILNADTEYIL